MEETQVRPGRSRRQQTDQQTRRPPRYHVILLDDDDHSYDYVIQMCQKLFGHPLERGWVIARQVDTEGRSIVWTGTLELAELKRDQIHAFGTDPLIPRCQGSMTAVLEEAAS